MITGTSARVTAEVNRQSALAGDIAKLQTQVSTQKRLSGPSDDPVAAQRIANIRRTSSNEDAYAANADSAATMATRVDASMTTLSTSLVRVRELVIQSSNATYSAADRAAAATELRGIASDIDALSVAKDSRGQPLYPDQVLAVPIADGKAVAATTTKAALFGSVQTAGGVRSLSDIVNAAADGLELTDPDARAAASATSLDAVAAATSHVADAHAEQGVRAARIDAQSNALADSKTDLATEREGLEATDMTSAIALIQSKLTTLQAAQTVFGKINQTNLFDLLR